MQTQSTEPIYNIGIRPATKARIDSGLPIEYIARRARVAPEYIKRAEREGCSYHLASKISKLTGAALEDFLPKRKARSFKGSRNKATDTQNKAVKRANA